MELWVFIKEFLNEKRLGHEHLDTLHIANNLDKLLHNQGHLDDDRDLYERAFRSIEELLRPEHHHALTSVHNLAGLHKDQGHFFEARLLFERALRGYEKALMRHAHSRTGTLITLNSLAYLLQAG